MGSGKNFVRYLKWRVGTEPYSRLFWGVGFPLYKPYPYSLYIGEDSSILGTNEMFGDGKWQALLSTDSGDSPSQICDMC